MAIFTKSMLGPALVISIPWLISLVICILFVCNVEVHKVFGIYPRRIDKILSIFGAPFLHVDFIHFLSNTPSWILLGLGMYYLSGICMIFVTIFVVFFSGLLTWAIAPMNEIHMGASGLIFGYLGFLISTLFFMRPIKFKWLLVCGLLSFYHILLLFSIFSANKNGHSVSWQMHLFGFLGGCIAGYLYHITYAKYRASREAAAQNIAARNQEEGDMTNASLIDELDKAEKAQKIMDEKKNNKKDKLNKADDTIPLSNEDAMDSGKPAFQYNDYGRSSYNTKRNSYTANPFEDEDDDKNNPYKF